MESEQPPPDTAETECHQQRMALVGELAIDGIRDRAVLAAIGRVPRHQFVPEALRGEAYRNHPLPIGYDQTISQPLVVAMMSELAAIKAGSRVLVVGTGSGYQDAVLAELGAEVFSVEIIPELAATAQQVLRKLGYHQVHVKVGDGHQGWPEAAPFDAIVVTAAPVQVPEGLKSQLAETGRMVIPVGESFTQWLRLIVRNGDRFEETDLSPVRFVPMTGA